MASGWQRRLQNTNHVASCKKSGGNAPAGNGDAPAGLIQMGLAAGLLVLALANAYVRGTPATAQNFGSHASCGRRKASLPASARVAGRITLGPNKKGRRPKPHPRGGG